MERGKIKILYVDDDRSNLEVFKATFRREYEIILAGSAKEGYELLKNNSCPIVIADQKMPEMTGVDFFELIKNEYPDSIRILLTGYTDIESVINAINKGQVYRYITKPWNEHELRVAIDNAYEIYDVRQRLANTNKELQKRNDELNRFVYSASHEMKAPLMTILGILKMAAAHKDLDPAQYFSMIEKCTKNLEVFIKNIVDYYRNQRYDEKLKEIEIKSFIKDLLQTFLFNDHIAEINFNISSNQEIPFVTDEFRFKVILNNILSNSIKYQREDNEYKKVNVQIKVDEKFAEITIEDNGIGIPEKYKESIFNMFFRATEYGQGSGIGLYIVKEAVEKLEGKIDVQSKEGEGSTFKILIPNRHLEMSKLNEIPGFARKD